MHFNAEEVKIRGKGTAKFIQTTNRRNGDETQAIQKWNKISRWKSESLLENMFDDHQLKMFSGCNLCVVKIT